MDTNTVTSLIYQAIFITIFIVASTITINLFTTINDYSNLVDKTVKADAISEVVSENEDDVKYIEGLTHEYTGYEVYSLVNNYGLTIGTNNNNILLYVTGRKYERDPSALLPYIVTVLDKDNRYVNRIENIKLTSKYSVEYEYGKSIKVSVNTNTSIKDVKDNTLFNFDSNAMTINNYKKIIVKEKGD